MSHYGRQREPLATAHRVYLLCVLLVSETHFHTHTKPQKKL
jgi:hypothetical protein